MYMKIWSRKIGFVMVCSLLILGAIFFYQVSKFNDGKLHLVFCDVGQGDAIYIRSPKGLDILVDGGPDDSVLSCLSNHMPFWDRQIEVVILTHPHEDHLAGLISVIKRYSVLSFYTEEVGVKSSVFKELTKELARKEIKIRNLQKGDTLRLKDGLVLETISPSSYQINYAKTKENIDLDANGLSVVQLVTYGRFTSLLTGDSILKNSENIGSPIDVLKVPHHGSRNNLSLAFLDSINPKLAVITVGKNNRYGHPHKEILEMLEELKIKTLRTDSDGEVEVVSDGKSFWAQN